MVGGDGADIWQSVIGGWLSLYLTCTCPCDRLFIVSSSIRTSSSTSLETPPRKARTSG